MMKLDPIQYLTGFLMGVFFGFIAEGVFFIIFNLLCTWLKCTHLDIAWWMLIALPMLLGVITGKTIASLHLEDY